MRTQMENYERARELVTDWLEDHGPYKGAQVSLAAKDDLILRISEALRTGRET